VNPAQQPTLVTFNDERYFSEAALVAALAAVYVKDGRYMVMVAQLCDFVDHTGRLLGRVRVAAMKLPAAGAVAR
jgi:hypothetical protein